MKKCSMCEKEFISNPKTALCNSCFNIAYRNEMGIRLMKHMKDPYFAKALEEIGYYLEHDETDGVSVKLHKKGE